jgi:hypothetical protein
VSDGLVALLVVFTAVMAYVAGFIRGVNWASAPVEQLPEPAAPPAPADLDEREQIEAIRSANRRLQDFASRN